MARLFSAGFEMGDVLEFGTVVNASVVATPVRSGTYACLLYTGNSIANPVSPTPSDEVYVRVAVRRPNGHGPTLYVQLRNATDDTNLGYLTFVAGQAVKAYDGAGTLLGTGSTLFGTDIWYLVEFHYKVAIVDGVAQIKIDGVQEVNFSGDTQGAGGAAIGYLRLYNTGGIGENEYVDDIALNDISGTVQNAWPGDGKIVAILPNADGDSSQFTGSDGDKLSNYLLVDDRPNDGDTTYVESGVVGEKDLYHMAAMPALPAGDIINVVWACARAKETAAAGTAFNLGVKSGVTEDWGGNLVLSPTYKGFAGPVLMTDPDTGVAWTEAGVNALQAGVKVA